LQSRYAHLFRPTRRDDVIKKLQAMADRNIERYGLLEPEVAPAVPAAMSNEPVEVA